jgi:hypothetical protein
MKQNYSIIVILLLGRLLDNWFNLFAPQLFRNILFFLTCLCYILLDARQITRISKLQTTRPSAFLLGNPTLTKPPSPRPRRREAKAERGKASTRADAGLC